MPLPFWEFFDSSTVAGAFLLVLAFFILGAAVKFIDDAFDEHAYSRKIALILAPITAIFWAYIMALNPASALLLTAITIGVLVKGKIDNVAFITAVLCIYIVYFFIGSWDFILSFSYLLALIVISVAGVIDEVGNDYIDRHNVYKKGLIGKILHLFFEYRFFMKLVVLLFVLLNYFSIVFFVAFFFWDLGYEVIMHYSKRVLRNRKFYYDKQANGY